MAGGLLNQAPAPDPATPGDTADPAAAPDAGAAPIANDPPSQGGLGAGGRTPNAPPGMQLEYNQFVANAYKLIYSPKGMAAMQHALQASPDFVLNLANSTAILVMRLMDSATAAQHPIPSAVLLQGGREILTDLADFSAKANIHQYTPDEIDHAALKAMDLARQFLMRAGKLDTSHAKADMSKLRAMHSAGQLDKWAPGVTKAFDKRQVTMAHAQRAAAMGPPTQRGSAGGLMRGSVAPPGKPSPPAPLRTSARPAPPAAQARLPHVARGKPHPGSGG